MYVDYENLHSNQSNDKAEVVDKVEQKPKLDRFDVGCLREGAGHREVDWGQHHHDGNVDGQTQVILILALYEHRSLIYRVHEKRWNIGHN